jgi:hypothetical protein
MNCILNMNHESSYLDSMFRFKFIGRNAALLRVTKVTDCSRWFLFRLDGAANVGFFKDYVHKLVVFFNVLCNNRLARPVLEGLRDMGCFSGIVAAACRLY